MHEPKQYPQLLHKTLQEVNTAVKRLPSGDLSYYYKKMEEYVDALFTRFAPFQPNDCVQITKNISPFPTGWHGCEQFIRVGALGVVCYTDYRDGKFIAEVKMNEEPVEQDRKHLFTFSEEYITRVLC